MKPNNVYLLLCLIGFLLPYAEFAPWLRQHGLDLPLFMRELFSNRVGAFFAMDVIVSAVTLILFTRFEATRLNIRARWIVVAAVLAVGVSLALPLFLYLRERELDRPVLARR